SHSEDLALVAVTRAGMVGVDVERVRPIEDADELVARFFSPREAETFKGLPLDQKPVAFFNLWTRKEAWLKATGEGISRSLHRVEVSFLPGEPAQLQSLPEDLTQNKSWALHDLAPAHGYAGALAVSTTNAQLSCWKWDPQRC
ncbi:MAG TPA: 4'-phosphopantetheinyl transferase superfamily protein, partial [Clostridia bacterium]|nr:4'-phosphopantetheinyl transferase superfamily protein [Clostridia bacterium]